MTNLNIQQGLNIEIVSSEITKKLYEAALSVPTPLEGELDDAYLSGNLLVDKTYRTYVSYLTTRFPDLHINVTTSYYIPFEDSNVLSVLMANNISSDGVGITEADASTANLGTIFKNNTTITSFDGFKYFTRANTNPSDYMFLGCTNLESIDLSETLNISRLQFALTSIKDINAPNLISLGVHASFSACHLLKTVTNLGQVRTIKASCFRDCDKLQSVVLPIECVTLEGEAFYMGQDYWKNGGSLQTIVGIEHISSFGTNCFMRQYNLRLGANDLLEAVTIGADAFWYVPLTVVNCPKLISLGEKAFKECKQLTSIECLGKITSIPDVCFLTNTSLLTVKIPYECTELKLGAFDGCSALTSIKQYTDSVDNWTEGVEPTVGPLSRITNFGKECFYNCSLLSLDASDFTSISLIGSKAFYNAGITGTLDLTNVTNMASDALLRSNITGLIVPNTIQNINFIGCLGLETITADMSLWTKVPRFTESTNILPFVVYQPLVTTIDVVGMFGTGWSAGAGEKTGPSTWTQFYWPAATSVFSAGMYFRNTLDLQGMFAGSRPYLKTIDVVYFKDIQNIDYYSLQYCKIKALVINNTTVPVIQNHSRDSSTITSNETSFINLHAETIIYVPDSAISTYQAAWPTHTIQGISTLNNGVCYETEADWTTAGKPVGLIGEYLGLNSTELASFVSTYNLTKWVNSNV